MNKKCKTQGKYLPTEIPTIEKVNQMVDVIIFKVVVITTVVRNLK